MKRVLTMILSVMLLLAPISAPAEEAAPAPLTTEEVIAILVDEIAEILSGAKPGLDVTLTSPEGETVSAAFGLTESGFSAKVAQPDLTLGFNEASAHFADASGAFAVPLQSLLTMLLTGDSASLPIPTEAELNALAALGQELAANLLSSNALAWSLSNQMLSLHIDLDALLSQLDASLPLLLHKYADQLEPLMARFSPFLFGEAISLDELVTVLWSAPFLSATKTGLVLEAVLFQTGNTTSLMASCMGWDFKLDLEENGLAFALTSPTGLAYAFDTQDFLILAGILSAVPSSITEEAFAYTQTTEYPEGSRYGVVTTNAAVDLALLERDVKAGLTKAISANADIIDALCSKYQPWIQLLTGYRRISTSTLVMLVDKINILPDWTGTLTAVFDQYSDTLNATASLAEDGEPFALLDLHYDAVSLNASLRDADGDFALMLTGVNDRYNTSLTLSCTEDLGGFSSITYATGYRNLSRYNTYTIITTDTDIFHYRQERTGLDLKLGDYSFKYHNCYDYGALSLDWPGGYLHYTASDTGMSLTSNLGTLSISPTCTGCKIDGTITDGHTPLHFSVLVDGENQLVTASILRYWGGSTHLTYRPGTLSILSAGSELILADAGTGTPTRNTARLTLDGDIIATIVTEVEREEDFLFRVYLGQDESAPCWTLRLDVGAAGPAFPADAVMLTPAEFLQRVNAILQPPVEAPVAEENPAEASTAESVPADDDPGAAEVAE